MSIDRAVPCGLILNELVTNALKHAFLTDQAGEIRMTFSKQEDGTHLLQVADNGMGFPAHIDPRTAPSLGLRLIRLLTQQLDGSFEIRATHPGTAAQLKLGGDDHANDR